MVNHDTRSGIAIFLKKIITAVIFSDLIRDINIIKTLPLDDIETLLDSLKRSFSESEEAYLPDFSRTIKALEERREEIIRAGFASSGNETDHFAEYAAKSDAMERLPSITQRAIFIKKFKSKYTALLDFVQEARSSGNLHYDYDSSCLSGSAAAEAMIKVHDLVSLIPNAQAEITEHDVDLDNDDSHESDKEGKKIKKRYDLTFKVPTQQARLIKDMVNNTLSDINIFEADTDIADKAIGSIYDLCCPAPNGSNPDSNHIQEEGVTLNLHCYSENPLYALRQKMSVSSSVTKVVRREVDFDDLSFSFDDSAKPSSSMKKRLEGMIAQKFTSMFRRKSSSSYAL